MSDQVWADIVLEIVLGLPNNPKISNDRNASEMTQVLYNNNSVMTQSLHSEDLMGGFKQHIKG